MGYLYYCSTIIITLGIINRIIIYYIGIKEKDIMMSYKEAIKYVNKTFPATKEIVEPMDKITNVVKDNSKKEDIHKLYYLYTEFKEIVNDI